MKTRKNWVPFVVVILFTILAGSGYSAWNTWKASQTPTTPGYQTTQVKRGDITQMVSGTGTLMAGKQMSLNFGTSGTVTEVRVQEGDLVRKGDVLAVLDGEELLKLDVSAKTIAVQLAEHDLEVLMASGGKNLANALIDLAKAQETYEIAKEDFHVKGDARCRNSKTESYYMDYIYSQNRVNEWESYLADGNTGYGTDYIHSKLIPMRNERDLNYMNWKYCEGYTDSELLNIKVKLEIAETRLQAARNEYELQKQNSGLDSDAVQRQEIVIKNSRLGLSAAKMELKGIQIIAPMNGVVIAVNGAVGERAGTSGSSGSSGPSGSVDQSGVSMFPMDAVIIGVNANNETSSGAFFTIADPDQPYIQAYLDEEDMANLKTGSQAEVVFDAAPKKVVNGIVTDINPSLVKYDGYSMIEVIVELQTTVKVKEIYLPWGLKAGVDIISSQSRDALLLLTEALLEKSEDHYVVRVLNNQGILEEREVQVGIQSGIYTEIKNGLTEGETVVTAKQEKQK